MFALSTLPNGDVEILSGSDGGRVAIARGDIPALIVSLQTQGSPSIPRGIIDLDPDE